MIEERMETKPAEFIRLAIKSTGSQDLKELSERSGVGYSTLRAWAVYGHSPTLGKWSAFVERVRELEKAK